MVGAIVVGNGGGCVVVDAGGLGVFSAASAGQARRTRVADGVLHVFDWHDFQRGVEYLLWLARAQLGIAAVCFGDKRFGADWASGADFGVCGRQKRDGVGIVVFDGGGVGVVGVFCV